LRSFTGLLYTSKAAAFRLSRVGTSRLILGQTTAVFDSGQWGSSMTSILRRGLGNNTRAIAILQPGTPFHPISSAERPCTPAVRVGVLYDPVHAFRVVNQRFDIYGGRAELDRSKDGLITQSVVWEVTTSDERAHS
ncbi:uncharacterized protein EDB91DRAFT_1263628, partial [Suillus paluster]|uniref:uncharacterized protein n=1 Tax=Suillus paluster TaxID=48578 RepID=UPI001B878793